VHTAIRGITQDLEGFRFNTVISKLMILRNELKHAQSSGTVGVEAWQEAIRSFLLLAAPVFPHLAEELWTTTRGWPYSIHQQPWPQFDPALLEQAQLTIVVQVNGRVRDQVVVDAQVGRDEARLREIVLELPKVQQHTAGLTIQRVIVVPGKLANIVAR
jgi:leucyl-tRNA synthetase